MFGTQSILRQSDEKILNHTLFVATTDFGNYLFQGAW
jgi:hypothetical protein